jgi:hypothetical protein
MCVFWISHRRNKLSNKVLPRGLIISFTRSVKYGLGVLKTSISYRLQRMGLINSPLFVDTKAARLPILPDGHVEKSFVSKASV